MQSVADSLEEFCSSCGEWVSYISFDLATGWCIDCSRSIDHQQHCTRCGGVIAEEHGRTMCHTCRQEVWLETHADDLEFLIVVKGYSISYARDTITKMVRPICRWCGKPIKGGHATALFHKGNKYKACRSASLKVKRLQKRENLTTEQALARIRGSYVVGTNYRLMPIQGR